MAVKSNEALWRTARFAGGTTRTMDPSGIDATGTYVPDTGLASIVGYYATTVRHECTAYRAYSPVVA